MLQLVIGRSGSGKTETLRRQMAEDLTAGKDVVFLVPEQFSFESECNLASQLAGPDFFRLQVLSFTRLATRIFEAAGKSPRFLDAGGKALLAARAAMTASSVVTNSCRGGSRKRMQTGLPSRASYRASKSPC